MLQLFEVNVSNFLVSVKGCERVLYKNGMKENEELRGHVYNEACWGKSDVKLSLFSVYIEDAVGYALVAILVT